jgi:plasmid maintenance system antidote protein VapI
MPSHSLSAINPLIRSGDIKTFSEIFKHIPPSSVARKLKINYYKMKNIIDNPGKMDMEMVWKLSKLFKVKEERLFALVMSEYINQQ